MDHSLQHDTSLETDTNILSRGLGSCFNSWGSFGDCILDAVTAPFKFIWNVLVWSVAVAFDFVMVTLTFLAAVLSNEFVALLVALIVVLILLVVLGPAAFLISGLTLTQSIVAIIVIAAVAIWLVAKLIAKFGKSITTQVMKFLAWLTEWSGGDSEIRKFHNALTSMYAGEGWEYDDRPIDEAQMTAVVDEGIEIGNELGDDIEDAVNDGLGGITKVATNGLKQLLNTFFLPTVAIIVINNLSKDDSD